MNKLDLDPDFRIFAVGYTGSINVRVAYAEAKAKAEVLNGKFRNATYDTATNRRLEREYIANARKDAGARC